MLGTNKSGSIVRIGRTTNTSSIIVPSFRYRTKPVTFFDYSISAHQVTRMLFCDLNDDVQVGDRVLGTDGNYTVMTVSRYVDDLGKHSEIMIREVNSLSVHKTVTVRDIAEDQLYYDPILKEWTGTVNYTDYTIKALVDAKELAKESFIQFIEQGKLEQVDWIMTVDFPYLFGSKTKIIFDGFTYDISWQVPGPYEYTVGLQRALTKENHPV